MRTAQLGEALLGARLGQRALALLLAMVLLVASSGIAHASVVDHLVRSGESLWLLSVRHHTTVPSIQRLNGLTGTTIYPGQGLWIPADSRVHVVSRGETLSEIARWYRAEVGAIKSANSISGLIHPGQQLVIPATAPAETATTASASASSEANVDLLARLVQAEATGEPYSGKVAVAAVVLNRVRSPNFPNTIGGVVYQPMQFCPVGNGTIYRPAGSEAHRAVRDAMSGWDPSGGALFFFNPANTSNAFIWSRPLVITIGNHRFTR